jgi:hypothetical protein
MAFLPRSLIDLFLLQRFYARCCKDTRDLDLSRPAPKKTGEKKTQAEILAEAAAEKAQARAATLRAQAAAKAENAEKPAGEAPKGAAAAPAASSKAAGPKPENGDQANLKYSHWTEVLKTFAKHLWPEDSGLRKRVVLAVGLLITSKLLNIQVPILFKQIIDALSVTNTDLAVVIPAAILIGYGAARAGSALFQELRNTVFSHVPPLAQHGSQFPSFSSDWRPFPRY